MIAFIDGAVDRAHASLRRAHIEVIDRTQSPCPAAREHATFIASLFAGAGPHCLGLAPECPILNVGVVDDAMVGGAIPPRNSAARLASAVDLASARGARIIQISLDLSFHTAEAHPLVVAVEAAVRRGAVVIIAAGQRPLAPANPLLLVPGVIPVSGVDHHGYPLHSVHRSAALSVCGISAPAIDIPGAVLPTGTALRTGTSFAACFVTAAIALMCSAIPAMAPRDAARRILAERFASRRGAIPVPLDVDGCFIFIRSIQEDADDR
jgi:subtilisin family serine protease